MSQITAAMVKELRETSGAGMMDCKKALAEAEGDMDAAVDWLRKKGLAKAAKKAGRAAAEGLVSVLTEGTKGVVVEINSETDFVARNAEFQAFVEEVTKLALEIDGDVEALRAATLTSTGKTVADSLTDLIARIGEHMELRRLSRLSVENGSVAGYVHGALCPGMGTIGVLVALESDSDSSALDAAGKQIAMHVAAARPECLRIEDVDTAALDREREVLAEQARASGKPENIIEKMVEGRLRKYYEEVVLLQQIYVIDNETKIADVVANLGKETGKPVALTGFVRMALGEGVEKEEQDFAAEVAATLAS